MTTPITNTATTTPITDVLGVANNGSSVQRTDAKGNLDKTTFLKLLVAQLKYQDPSSPVDSAQFMSQTAQLQQVDSLNVMSTSMTSMLTAQKLLNGTSLIGMTVTYTGTDGKDATGVVSSASFSAVDGATLHLGGTDGVDIAVDAVTKVAPTPAASKSTTSGTPTTGTTTSA